jgi:hypothetical protein
MDSLPSSVVAEADIGERQGQQPEHRGDPEYVLHGHDPSHRAGARRLDRHVRRSTLGFEIGRPKIA